MLVCQQLEGDNNFEEPVISRDCNFRFRFFVDITTPVVYVNVLYDITWLKAIYDHGHEQEQIKGLKLSKPKSE